MDCNISIGQLNFDYVNKVEVNSSWSLLTDTAMIVLPSNLKVKHHEFSKVMKVGDQVQIKLGYNKDLQTVFKGYVTSITPKVPIEITCEDEMWKVKQSNISDSGKTLELAGLLSKHFGEYQSKHPNIKLGAYRYSNVSKAKVLEKIKSDFGLYSFFRNDTLNIGLQYDPEISSEHIFKLDYNMIGDNLEFKRKEDLKLKVKAISNNQDGTKTEVEIGDEFGEQRTLNFYNLSASNLKTTAEREMERLRYDGYRGNFTAFGKPYVKHGDIVKLSDEDYRGNSDKKGSYYVDGVKTTFGIDGYRQEITLGPVIQK